MAESFSSARVPTPQELHRILQERVWEQVAGGGRFQDFIPRDSFLPLGVAAGVASHQIRKLSAHLPLSRAIHVETISQFAASIELTDPALPATSGPSPFIRPNAVKLASAAILPSFYCCSGRREEGRQYLIRLINREISMIKHKRVSAFHPLRLARGGHT